MKKTGKVFAVTAALALAVTAMTGCGGDGKNAEQGGSAKLTYWAPLYAHYSPTYTNMGDSPFYQELQKRTGVELEFIHPTVGQENEQFNLMVASGDLTDLVEHGMLDYKGGPEKAIQDKVIIDITDQIKQNAPNLTKVLQENPSWDKQVKTDAGKYYCFPAIRGAESLCYWNGLQIREDYLQKVGMEKPETIAEWEAVLTAFKDQLGIAYPLTLLNNNSSVLSFLAPQYPFIGAYGITSDFYLKDGTVHFGAIESQYVDYLKLFNSWYQKGLLDPDYATQDSKTYDAKIASGKSAAYINSVGGGMAKYIAATQANDPNAKISAVKYPVLNKGDEPNIGFKEFEYIQHQSVSITPKCENVEAAVKFLDYGYSDEGHDLFNFGIEGVSYNMIDGYPTYTEEVTHNPEGLSMMNAMTKYNRGTLLGPTVQDPRYFEQYMPLPEQKETSEIWALNDTSWLMPPVTLTSEESGKITSKLNEINNYRREMELKFIMGVEPIDNFDNYVQHLKGMGIDDVIAVYQAAVERYNAR